MNWYFVYLDGDRPQIIREFANKTEALVAYNLLPENCGNIDPLPIPSPHDLGIKGCCRATIILVDDAWLDARER